MDASSYLEGRSRETAIFRDARGRWFNAGEPLEHPALIRAFERWIERAPDGRYCLRNAINWAYISIEGAPLFVRTLEIANASDASKQQVRLRLSDDRIEPLDARTLRIGPDDRLYCVVRDGSMVAEFDAVAACQLAPLLGEDEQGVFVRVAGERARPVTMTDPLHLPT